MAMNGLGRLCKEWLVFKYNLLLLGGNLPGVNVEGLSSRIAWFHMDQFKHEMLATTFEAGIRGIIVLLVPDYLKSGPEVDAWKATGRRADSHWLASDPMYANASFMSFSIDETKLLKIYL
jgi:hypothetical protein